ncbi:hypothetical protein MATL_G00235320 [Megalops atlanticus]|uniref:Uncharacterized protein n=1 Tax=Megalops atlanticus TaxID=7932 RepID=A0A9D3PHZ1_MEGAT|nr:hypothetical protein MATL_G00235320 [Megalops atlanticus]
MTTRLASFPWLGSVCPASTLRLWILPLKWRPKVLGLRIRESRPPFSKDHCHTPGGGKQFDLK